MWDSGWELAGTLFALATALKERDLHTSVHSSRTTMLARQLGERCGLAGSQLDLLEAAAALHDIGKIGIPDRVLLKPGRLDATEWEIMKGHSEIGSRMLDSLPLEDMAELVIVVRHHHEHYDGSGYPHGLSGESIPQLSRIIALADCYDAMASTRPYHKPRTHEQIMQVMCGEARGNFDPLILRQFIELIDTSAYRADRSSGDSAGE
jgi:HD-GYP domain-containing protein (c-di-GMP phosphodiesterase class II)